jgi:penicillin-binding protein 1A
MVLGSGDYTPLQMARGYAVFSSGGFLPKPYLIRKIVNSNGTQISLLNCPLGYAPPPDETAIPPGVAYLMTEMMQQVIKIGTGVAAQSLGRNDIAGKTGTTNHETNAWFNGFTPKITTTVWVGYDDNRSMGRWAAGAREALPIWIHYMRTAISTRPQGGFFRPPDVAGPTESSASPVGVADYLAAYPPVAATASSESGEGSATDSGSKLIDHQKSVLTTRSRHPTAPDPSRARLCFDPNGRQWLGWQTVPIALPKESEGCNPHSKVTPSPSRVISRRLALPPSRPPSPTRN